MKTITLTANNRPQYTKQLLDSLRANRTDGYTLHCFLEPGCPENESLCHAVDWMPCEVHVNESRLGVRGNPFHALEYVFNAGSHFNVYLEDDIELSPDALDLCGWYAANMPHCMSLQLFNYFSFADNPMERWESAPDASLVCLGRNGLFPHFSALGLAMHRESWVKHFEPQWWVHPSGWDWSIESYLLSQYADGKELLLATPLVARANHTGRLGGTHCEPGFHDRMFGRIKLNGYSNVRYHSKHREWGPGQRPQEALGNF